jgi:hypothetical protein
MGQQPLVPQRVTRTLGGVETWAGVSMDPQVLDKNGRDIGKSQSIWTGSKMESPGSRGTTVATAAFSLASLMKGSSATHCHLRR